ncbi:MAG: hypothetical protein MAG451_01729 [Anaerolineales bacterium]|nr:hypothetical protein [Anaerolineales bacterium]
MLEQVLAIHEHEDVAINRQSIGLAAELAVQLPEGGQHVRCVGVPDLCRLLRHVIIQRFQVPVAGEVADVGWVESDDVEGAGAGYEFGLLLLVDAREGNLDDLDVDTGVLDFAVPKLVGLQVVASVPYHVDGHIVELGGSLPLNNIQRGWRLWGGRSLLLGWRGGDLFLLGGSRRRRPWSASRCHNQQADHDDGSHRPQNLLCAHNILLLWSSDGSGNETVGHTIDDEVLAGELHLLSG